jgi:xanthine phosphoribosyltransferase
MGFLIEKEFQGGRHLLQLEGIQRIESLAIIESLTDSQIKIKND